MGKGCGQAGVIDRVMAVWQRDLQESARKLKLLRLETIIARVPLTIESSKSFITQNVWLLSILVGSPYALFVWRRRRKSNSAL